MVVSRITYKNVHKVLTTAQGQSNCSINRVYFYYSTYSFKVSKTLKDVKGGAHKIRELEEVQG